MKAIRTFKCKIGRSDAIDDLVIQYTQAASWVSEQVFKSREKNSNRLHRAFYGTIREKFKLPSQLSCSIFRQVTSTYKTIASSGNWNLAVYRKPTLPLTIGRDLLRNKRGITILGQFISLEKVSLPDGKWQDSKLKRIGKVWYLLLAHEVEIPDPKISGSIVGVDFGIKRLMVATNSDNHKTFFFKGGVENHHRSCIRRTRAAVQSVGTRSSRRLLKRMSGHEASVTVNLLHRASKQLVSYAVANGARRIVCEDLSNVRDSSLNKGKDLRSKVHRWPYAKGQFFVSYKAAAVGIEFEKINPRNTSRGCPLCGDVSVSNRNGLQFCCKKCGHRDDADRNASKNIRMRSVVSAQAVDTSRSNKPLKSYGTNDIAAMSHVVNDDPVSVEVLAKTHKARCL